MRVFLGVALVGLVVCVGCGREPEARVPRTRMGGVAVTDDGMIHFSKSYFPPIALRRHVDLGYTKVTDAGMVHLKEFTRLEVLDLSWTKVTDAGLVHLKGLTKLRDLNLEGTKVTDAGLVHFKGLTKLRDLNLVATRVTDAGKEKLLQALPILSFY